MPKQPAISRFFADALGAPLRNVRWSWGAEHPSLGHLVLRVWEDQITADGLWIKVLHHRDRVRGTGSGMKIVHVTDW